MWEPTLAGANALKELTERSNFKKVVIGHVAGNPKRCDKYVSRKPRRQ
jgi:hypothetical protein